MTHVRHCAMAPNSIIPAMRPHVILVICNRLSVLFPLSVDFLEL